MEENNYQPVVADNNDNGITLMDLWYILKKYFFRILLLTAILTVIAGALFMRFVKTTYTASASIIMNPGLMDSNTDVPDDSATINSGYNAQYATYYSYSIRFLPSIAKFIKTSQRVKDEINQKVKLRDAFTYSDGSPLNEDEMPIIKNVESVSKGTLTVSTNSDELQIFITYTTTTSAEAARATLVALAYSICSVSKATENNQYIYLWANTLHVDDLPQKAPPGNNKWWLYTLIAFVGFFVIFYVYYLIATLLDDTIKSKREIEAISGFNVMAYIEEINRGKSSSEKKKKRSTKVSSGS